MEEEVEPLVWGTHAHAARIPILSPFYAYIVMNLFPIRMTSWNGASISMPILPNTGLLNVSFANTGNTFESIACVFA